MCCYYLLLCLAGPLMTFPDFHLLQLSLDIQRFALCRGSSGVISRSASSSLWQTASFQSGRDFKKLPSRCRVLVLLWNNGASVSGWVSCWTNRTKMDYIHFFYLWTIKPWLNKQNELFRLQNVVTPHFIGHFTCLVLQSHKLQHYLSLSCMTCSVTIEFNYRRLLFGPSKQTSVYWFSLRPIWSLYVHCELAE